MKVHFQIDYLNKDGDSVETFSAIDKDNKIERELLHKILDEFLDENTIWDSNKMNEHTRFIVFGSECKCH